MGKIGIFADVQNIYYTTRQAFGRPFNYRKLWQTIEQQGEIVCANAYAIDRDDAGQRKFQTALHHLGFCVKLKPFIQRSDGSAKGDWDVGITIDIMEAAAELDTVILLSGDGDFAILFDKIREKYKVHTIAYGVAALTADSLIDASDVYHRIEEPLLM